MTLVELLVTTMLLSIISAGIMIVFASAIRAESDLSHRFEAQQAVRLGLERLRADVHCSSGVSPSSGTVTSVTLTIPSGCVTAAGSVTWCAVSGSKGYDLWRVPAATCATSTTGSVRLATGMTAQSVFTPDATVHTGVNAPVLPDLTVNFTVSSSGRRYSAGDTLYLRNGTRQ